MSVAVCDGRCIMASELIECAPNVVAYPDPECSLHGSGDGPFGPFTPEEEEMLPPDLGVFL